MIIHSTKNEQLVKQEQTNNNVSDHKYNYLELLPMDLLKHFINNYLDMIFWMIWKRLIPSKIFTVDDGQLVEAKYRWIKKCYFRHHDGKLSLVESELAKILDELGAPTEEKMLLRSSSYKHPQRSHPGGTPISFSGKFRVLIIGNFW